MHMSEREYFNTLEGAMRRRGLDAEAMERVSSAVARLAALLGAANHIYVGQRGSAIGLSLGASDRVDVYIHGSYLDVAPAAIERAGGFGEIADALPGARRGSGQRSSYGRLPLQ